MHRNITVQPRIALQRDTVGVVGGAIQCFDALIGGRKEGPIEAPSYWTDTSVQIGIETLAQSLREILEIARTDFRRRDEKNVVVILIAKRTHVPAQIMKSGKLGLAAQPGFPGVGDHLLERRIGGKRIGQA